MYHTPKLFTIVFILFFCLLNELMSQDNFKDEYEERIKLEELPESVQKAMLPLIKDIKKVKIYKERQNDQLYYEAKYVQKKENISAKFDSVGIAIDIEVQQSFDKLSQSIQDSIEIFILKKSSKYEIKKIQIQYFSNDADLVAKFLADARSLPQNYEIEIVTKSTDEKSNGAFEIIFNIDGRFISKRRIKSAPSDNIIY